MNTVRPCGCKGVRSCLECEKVYNISKPSQREQLEQLEAWSYCSECELIYPGLDCQHELHDERPGLPFPGVYVKENFLNKEEGSSLMSDLDELPWTISQSGRRKQNFGPKTNFKKRKLQNGNFKGFPKFSEFVQERFQQIPLLRDFQAIEQCSLEYDPTKGASIDPHVDDCWIWGERVVTVNCLGDAVLTLTLFDDRGIGKYNLDIVDQYEKDLLAPLLSADDIEKYKGKFIRIAMPSLSIITLYGPARYQFEHSILREDIQERRVCLAYREFTPMYITGDSREKADIVRENAKQFWTIAAN